MSPKKKVTQKKAAKKPAKKVSTPKAAKKTVKKKATPSKSTPVKKVTKKVAKKKSPAKTTQPKKENKQPKGTKSNQSTNMSSEFDEKKEAIVLGARKRKATPTIFKIRARKQTPIVFTLEDVQEIVKKKASEKTPSKTTIQKAPVAPAKKFPARKITEEKVAPRNLGAASVADILGFNPNDKKSKPRNMIDESKIPSKWMKYYKALVKLREHVQEGLDFHAQDTLKRSSKEDTGDLSSYSQHMADAGTDTFDRDFALSMVSSEQDALFEIDQAVQRILNGTFGICEITGKAIPAARLAAVPFTRCSLEGQKQLEATQKATQRERGGVFSESSLEESIKYTDEDSDS